MWETAEKRFTRIMPLEFTVDGELMKDVNEDIKEACRQLYAYTYRLREMFDKEREKLYLDIIPELLNSLNFFAVNLVECKQDDDMFFLCSQQEMAKLLGGYQQINLKKLSKNGVYFGDRIDSLIHLGYLVTFDDNNYKIVNTKYPLMFKALRLLKEAAEKQPRNFGQYMIVCLDFRIIANPKYLQTCEDIIVLMYPDEMKKGAFELCNYAKELKLSAKPYMSDGIHFTYKGKVVASLHRNEFRIKIRTEKDANEMINLMDDEQRKFFYKHLKFCNHCTPSHKNGFQFVLQDKTVRLCELGLTLRISDFDNIETVINTKTIVKMVKEKVIN